MTASPPRGQAHGGEGHPSLTAAAIAHLVDGTLLGDAGATVHGVAPLDRASSEDLSFLASGKYAPLFERSMAGVVLLPQSLAEARGSARARVIVREPYEAMLRVLPSLYPSATDAPSIHASAVIGRGARLGAGVSIGAHSVIEDGAELGDGVRVGPVCMVGRHVRVGERSRLFPGVTLYEGTTLGRRVTVHAGARIGADGFGYVYREGEHRKIPHVGRCIVDDDVEIGANTTIDRGSIDDTVIGAGTKIDNLVHVGHNVRLGRLCLVMAQVGISGSVRIGDGVILAGQAGIGGHLTIGDGARIAGQAGVFGDVPAGASWSGYPARPHREALRAQAALFRLSGLIARIERLLERDGR